MSTPAAPHGKILLIDDDEYIAVSLRGYLTALHWDVDVAADAAAAARLAKANSYGVIVVDPFLTGAVYEEKGVQLRAIRNAQPDAQMIVLTGYASLDLARAAGECRVAAVLRKPQSVVSLTQVITAAMKGRNEGKSL